MIHTVWTTEFDLKGKPTGVFPEFKKGSCLFWSLYYCHADSKLHEKKFLCHWSIVWSKKKVWMKYVFDKLFQVFFKNFKSKMCKRHDNDFTILLPIEKSKGNNTNIALIYFYHGSSVLSICHFKFSALNHFKHFYLPWAGVCPNGKVRMLKAFKKSRCVFGPNWNKGYVVRTLSYNWL